MSRVVIFPNSGKVALLLHSAESKDGVVVKGYVENGAWHYRLRNGEHQALDEYRRIANRWPVTSPTIEIPVPDSVRGDYNAVIHWAQQQP